MALLEDEERGEELLCPNCEQPLSQYFYVKYDGGLVDVHIDDFLLVCLEPQCPNIIVDIEKD